MTGRLGQSPLIVAGGVQARDRRHRFAALHLVSARGGLGGSWFCRFAEVDLCGRGGGFGQWTQWTLYAVATFRRETSLLFYRVARSVDILRFQPRNIAQIHTV